MRGAANAGRSNSSVIDDQLLPSARQPPCHLASVPFVNQAHTYVDSFTFTDRTHVSANAPHSNANANVTTHFSNYLSIRLSVHPFVHFCPCLRWTTHHNSLVFNNRLIHTIPPTHGVLCQIYPDLVSVHLNDRFHMDSCVQDYTHTYTYTRRSTPNRTVSDSGLMVRYGSSFEQFKR